MAKTAPEATALTELLGLDPADFTARRNVLVKQLKAAGEKEAAVRLAAVRKPSNHLWAVNHLARERSLAVTRLLSAAADLADAQARAFAGESGAGERLRRDSGAYQRALDLAVREGGQLVREGGRPVAEETLRRIRDVLAGAALGDDDLRAQLTAGILREEPPPPGAAAFTFGGTLADPPPRPAKSESLAPRKAPAPAAAQEAAPKLSKEDHRRLLEARKTAATSATAARRLAEVARRARRRAEAAAAEAASADREAVEAETRAATAAAEAGAADGELARLQERR